MVRMTVYDAVELKAKLVEMGNAQRAFSTPPQLRVGHGVYSRPLGPYYTQLSITAKDLLNDFDFVSREPIRYLTIMDCRPDEDTAMIMRNHRMAELFKLTFQFSRAPRQTMAVADAVRNAKFNWLQSLTISGVYDQNRMIQCYFQMNRNIALGCKLFMGRPPVQVAVAN